MSRMRVDGLKADIAAHSDAKAARVLQRESLRNRMIATAHYRDGYSIRQIALAWKLHRTTVHRIVKRVRESMSVITGKK